MALRRKTPGRGGTAHPVMSPAEFMQQLAARAPVPRPYLIRFHGVAAPNAQLRAAVLPQGPLGKDQPSGRAESAQGNLSGASSKPSKPASAAKPTPGRAFEGPVDMPTRRVNPTEVPWAQGRSGASPDPHPRSSRAHLVSFV